MLQFDFENSVGFWVFVTNRDLARALTHELAPFGITSRQWEVLVWVASAERMSQSELAELMSIEAPTLVGVLSRMERDGWIQRVPDDNDRRKKLIRITQRVVPLWDELMQCIHHVRAQATRGLSPEQIANLRDTLATVRHNVVESAQ
jgi:MarR family transcriptional regulator for hemolysin